MESFDVMWVLAHSFYAALLIAFILILLKKWGVIEWYQIRRPRWMPHDCTFCFGFWAGVVLCGVWCFVVAFDPHLIFCLPIIPVFTILAYKIR